ncbi:MAG: cobalt ECF transporter T component CbiQ [Candidatus Micrarchaeota archaeon]
MSSIDEMAYRSPLRAWSPVGKLLLCVALLAGSILAPSPFVPLLVLVIGLALLAHSSSLRLPDIVKFACLETVVMLFISVAIIALLMPGTPFLSFSIAGLPVVITREAFNLAILLFIRAAAGFSVLLFFASSTPIPHLFHALRQAGLPAHVAELTVLIYRYSFMLIEQLGQMFTAADCRMGFLGIRRSLRTCGLILANLFGRSMDFAERAEAALYCRNFKGEFPLLRLPPRLSMRWILASASVFVALFLIGRASVGWLTV